MCKAAPCVCATSHASTTSTLPISSSGATANMTVSTTHDKAMLEQAPFSRSQRKVPAESETQAENREQQQQQQTAATEGGVEKVAFEHAALVPRTIYATAHAVCANFPEPKYGILDCFDSDCEQDPDAEGTCLCEQSGF